MATNTVGAHLDDLTIEKLRSVAKSDNRPTSQILGVAIKSLLDQSPGARQALFAIDGIANANERAYAARQIGRSILKAYEGILEARRAPAYRPTGNAALDTEEAIEAEAIRACAK